MAVFFISDTHFGHGNILRYCNRPFLSEEEQVLLALGRDFRVSEKSVRRMDDAMIDTINAAVGPDDTLWHLGDFCFGDYDRARALRDRIRCRTVYLLWGNHDDHEVRDLFSDCHQQVRITVEEQKIFLNHYPMISWHGSSKGTWMLHGHTHGTLRRNPLVREFYDTIPILDVGVDGPDGPGSAHTFRPWSMDELRLAMRSKRGTNGQWGGDD